MVTASLRERWRIDVSDEVALPGRFAIAVDVVLPASGRPPSALLFCLPGGFLSRRYFDLGDPEKPEERSYSFAAAMAERGYAVAMADHLGIGDSTRPADPEDGYQLDVDALARANQAAWQTVRARLVERYALGGDENLVSVGVGHSMGSALTVAQQSNHRPHAALVLQSFSTTGLPAFLQGNEAEYANEPARIRTDLADLVRARFGTPYPGAADDDAPGERAAFSVGTASPLAEALLHRASSPLVAMAGLLTMIPGGYAPYAEAIDVPVFVNYGDHDLGRAQHAAPTLPNAPEVVAYTLADSWHCHNVANTRHQLWDRTARWLREVLA